MSPARLVIVGEGHGEVRALANLVARVGSSAWVIPSTLFVGGIHRRPITDEASAVRAARFLAQGAGAVLLTADLDRRCPRTVAPEWADALRTASIGVPTALVLFHPESETLALSVADRLAGRQVAGVTLRTPLDPLADPEAHSGAKEWIRRNLLPAYKPSTHQLALTQAMDIAELRAAGLSSYRRLESALRFLAASVEAGTTGVYPGGNDADS